MNNIQSLLLRCLSSDRGDRIICRFIITIQDLSDYIWWGTIDLATGNSFPGKLFSKWCSACISLHLFILQNHWASLCLSHYARCYETYKNESDSDLSLEGLETNTKYAHKSSNCSEKVDIDSCSKMAWREAWVSFIVSQEREIGFQLEKILNISVEEVTVEDVLKDELDFETEMGWKGHFM